MNRHKQPPERGHTDSRIVGPFNCAAHVAERGMETRRTQVPPRTTRNVRLAGLVLAGTAFLAAAAAPPDAQVMKRPTVSFELLFHDLKVQGQWLQLENGPWVWKPTGVPGDWRPYSRGTWIVTEAGWYWLSEYPWGYATSHYGSWAHDGKEGWVWHPSSRWSPATVIWMEDETRLAWCVRPPAESRQPDDNRPQPGLTAMRWDDIERALMPRAGGARPVGQANVLEGIAVSSSTVSAVSADVATAAGESDRQAPDRALVERKTGRQQKPVKIMETRRRREVLIVARDQTILVVYRADLLENPEAIQALISRKAEEYRKIRERARGTR